MTPQEKQMLQELYEWMQERKRQAVPYPIDDNSLQAILDRLTSITFEGTSGLSLTQTYTDSDLDTLTGPKAYAGRVLIKANGTTYQIPYL